MDGRGTIGFRTIHREVLRARPRRAGHPPRDGQLQPQRAGRPDRSRDLAATDWSATPVYGWRDPKAPLRGYLVGDGADGPVGIALRAAESRMSARRSAMCFLCRTVLTADRVSLFSARRAGAAGRNGDTVGTYVCVDLACADRVHEVPRGLAGVDPELQRLAVVEQVEGLRARFTAFVGDVVSS